MKKKMIEATSQEANIPQESKLIQIEEINICLQVFGALSMRQISELTKIPYTSVTWRFYDDRLSRDPNWTQIGTHVINGRRYKLFDLINPSDWVERQYFNKDFYEAKEKMSMNPNPAPTYRKDECDECGQEIYIFKSYKNQKEYAANSDNRKDFHKCFKWRKPKKKTLTAETVPEEPAKTVWQDQPKAKPKPEQQAADFTESLGGSFKGSLDLTDAEWRDVERSLIEDISRAIVSYIQFYVDKKLKQ